MSDPSSIPDGVSDTGIVDTDAEPDQDGAPRADVESAPALQPRDSGGASDMLT